MIQGNHSLETVRFKTNQSVAYVLHPALEVKLNRMQLEGILESVKRNVWATPLVIVLKSDGKLRVCDDFKITINQCMETKTYPLPATEDIFFAHLAAGNCIIKYDST